MIPCEPSLVATVVLLGPCQLAQLGGQPANPGCSIKPWQVFIAADTDYELTFGLDHSPWGPF